MVDDTLTAKLLDIIDTERAKIAAQIPEHVVKRFKEFGINHVSPVNVKCDLNEFVNKVNAELHQQLDSTDAKFRVLCVDLQVN